MKQAILVVMAAGMGSRYGGLKQIDQLGPDGQTMLDYSISHAYQAGFRRLIFIIKKEFEGDFRSIVGDKYQDRFDIQYAYQELTDIPAPYKVPKDRIKPWGTAHAVWSARHIIDGPFAVINADDYYGPEAYQVIFKQLSETSSDQEYAMVGYKLRQTLSENGAVSRGLCKVNQDGFLISVEEQTQIEEIDGVVQFTEDGLNWQSVDPETTVSMNMWGFPASFVQVIDRQLNRFLKHALKSNPLKGEFYLPSVVMRQLNKKEAKVKVLMSPAQWFGVTYAEDKPIVQAYLENIQIS